MPVLPGNYLLQADCKLPRGSKLMDDLRTGTDQVLDMTRISVRTSLG
jgi:hypothetical protein